ncbi:MAG: SsrA-binding protein SmpB [Bacteroidales bacterium]|jgi:SsrA-binding protein|nr:SsrA-binding protein SmpB [Bacteroidales bacterium]
MEHQRIREFKNKKASYQYELTEHFVAGIQLRGTEIKSIRNGKVSFTDAYCVVENEEIYVRGLHISEYRFGTIYNHEPKRQRKLLLNRQEIRKIHKRVKERGNTVIPVALFINEKGLAKLEISLAQGKRLHDKREGIKEKDMKRDMERIRKF